jgi:hypothetical protein
MSSALDGLHEIDRFAVSDEWAELVVLRHAVAIATKRGERYRQHLDQLLGDEPLNSILPLGFSGLYRWHESKPNKR